MSIYQIAIRKFGFGIRLVSIAAVLALAIACSGGGGSDDAADTAGGAAVQPASRELVIYSGREEPLVGPIIEEFEKASGIDVSVKYGSTAQIAATILEEGSRSPADVFYSQDPGALGALTDQLQPLSSTILDKVAAPFRDAQGKWVGITGRARVVVYNTKLNESDLPDSIFDFADEKWKGRIGWAPTNGSLQAMITAMRVKSGEEATRGWLEEIKANGVKDYANNTAVVAAVAAGEVDVGFVNHYYLYGFLRDQGASFAARNYHLKQGDPGATVLVSGAGILTTAKNKENAQRFLEFMLSPVAQQYFNSRTFEYPLVGGVITQPGLVSLGNIQVPDIDLSKLSDLEGTLKLMRETGAIR